MIPKATPLTHLVLQTLSWHRFRLSRNASADSQPASSPGPSATGDLAGPPHLHPDPRGSSPPPAANWCPLWCLGRVPIGRAEAASQAWSRVQVRTKSSCHWWWQGTAAGQPLFRMAGWDGWLEQQSSSAAGCAAVAGVAASGDTGAAAADGGSVEAVITW